MKASTSRKDPSRNSCAKGDLENESKSSVNEMAEAECLAEKEDISRLMKKLLNKS